MATYSYNWLIDYNPAGGTTYAQGTHSGPIARSLNDNEGDTSFEVGDPTFLSTRYDFLGTVTIPLVGGGTVEVPVTEGDISEIQLYLPAGLSPADVVLPATLDTATFDTATFTTCFAAGSLISTTQGARAVETLAIGDMVLTETGAAVPVRWIGRQTVLPFFVDPRNQPVRIRAGALGDGLPHSDLTVTADHGMIVDGLVINASALVNGTSIDFVPLAELPDSFTVYHVATENHDVILANGAPAETFIDYVGRKGFDNYAEYVELYGAERIIPEMDRPRISTRRLLPEGIRARLGLANGSDSDRDIALTA